MRSREFTVTLDPEAKHRLERLLKITQPPSVSFVVERQNKTNGTYNAGTNHILIHLGRDLFQHSSLFAIKTAVLGTLLHEYRHAHQFATWDGEKITKDLQRPYWKQDMERDAREWSRLHTKEWFPLVKLSPKGTRSRLSRLSAAERSVR